MRNNDLRKELQICDRISEEDLNQIIEMMTYGSNGSIQLIIELLKTVLDRIELKGDKIIDGRNEQVFTSKSFRKFIIDNFSSYITKQLQKRLNEDRKK